MKEELLMVKIHNGLNEGKDLYEATRGNWRINAKRFDHILYVLGINEGKITSAYVPIMWNIVEDGPEAGRKNFVGVEASKDILKKVKHNEKELLSKFGGGAIAYANISDLRDMKKDRS